MSRTFSTPFSYRLGSLDRNGSSTHASLTAACQLILEAGNTGLDQLMLYESLNLSAAQTPDFTSLDDEVSETKAHQFLAVLFECIFVDGHFYVLRRSGC